MLIFEKFCVHFKWLIHNPSFLFRNSFAKYTINCSLEENSPSYSTASKFQYDTANAVVIFTVLHIADSFHFSSNNNNENPRLTVTKIVKSFNLFNDIGTWFISARPTYADV